LEHIRARVPDLRGEKERMTTSGKKERKEKKENGNQSCEFSFLVCCIIF